VILPARAREIEQTPALVEAPVGIGSGGDGEIAAVESGTALYRSLPQHAVAEHVTRHVADADNGERRRADVDVHLAEVALDRFPGAAGGDSHLLVVVAGPAAGGEWVVAPEAMLLRDRIGNVGERCRALVGRDHEIRIVVVMAQDIGRGETARGAAVLGE